MPSTDLSLILTNYNHARYLPQSISAVLSQSVRPKEFIILDDASTDDSLQVLEAFAARDPIIRLVRNERNRGVCATIQRGIGLATLLRDLATGAAREAQRTRIRQASAAIGAHVAVAGGEVDRSEQAVGARDAHTHRLGV